MPGFYNEGEYDLAGFCIGVVEKSRIIDGSQIKAGNKIIGLPSSGPHSNGYSLIRKVLERQGVVPNDDLLDDLLAPTRIYVKPVRELLRHMDVNGMVHITGGGFYENIPRVFTDQNHAACINLESWQRPEVFAWLQQAGNISEAEMLSTFNCGLGLLIIVNAQDSEAALDHLHAQGEQPLMVGEIVPADTPAQPGQLVIAGPSAK
jgi:phosphoribosylformylglycinamidine cyclo-ligase